MSADADEDGAVMAAATAVVALPLAYVCQLLGVDETGHCARHSQCPVVANLSDMTASLSSFSCGLCEQEEKGAQESVTAALAELQLTPQNNTNPVTDNTDAKKNTDTSSNTNTGKHSIDSKDTMQRMMHRVKQVQQQQLHEQVRRLEAALKEAQQQAQQQIASLRKTIQSDLKVISDLQQAQEKEEGVCATDALAVEGGSGGGGGECRVASSRGGSTPSPRHANPKALGGTKNLFQSFRGGLLDIPKSPPRPRHDYQAAHHEKKGKLQLNANALGALALPVSSSHNPTSSSSKTSFSKKEIPLAILDEGDQSRSLHDQSPEQLFETVTQAPPAAPVLRADQATAAATAAADKQEEEPSGAAAAAAPAGQQLHKDKIVFSVTGATCQDKFGDKGVYTGNILVTEGLPHGQGKMDYATGRIYQGEWTAGQWHGAGKLLNPNGDSYTGDFLLDARHGQGEYRWDNGDVYKGSFCQDKRHGRGEFSFANGNVYRGDFVDGMFSGFGRYEFGSGYYEGDWKDGRYNGAGELLYESGLKYTGEFRNSVAHGFGMEVWPDGRKRRGVWKNGAATEYFGASDAVAT